MSRFIACLLGLIGFGIILAEVLNNLGWFDFKLKTYAVAGPMVLVFLIFEGMFKRYEKKTGLSLNDDIAYKRINKIHGIVLALIGLFCLIGIPLLWWGAIKRLAMMANESTKGF